MAKPTGSNKENLERTRAHLLAIARECFATHGFHDASTTMIIEEAQSSRGTLYHHFPDKVALFKAVYDVLCQEVFEVIMQYPYKGDNPAEDLLAGCKAYLGVFVNQAFARIMLMDAPTVLSMDYCRSQDHQTAYKALKEGVAEIVTDGNAALMLTDFLSGALDTFAFRIATAQNREMAFEEYAASFEQLARKLIKN